MNKKEAAREYAKSLAEQDWRVGAITRYGGQMDVANSYPSIEAAFMAGAEWMISQLPDRLKST